MRRAAALRTLLGRVVRADVDATTRTLPSLLAPFSSASLLSARGAWAPSPLPLSSSAVRHNHCSCPTLRDDADGGPPRVRVAYDPADVEAFIAVADALEDAFPGAVVEGDDGGGGGGGAPEEAAQGQAQQQQQAAAVAVGGPGCGHFVVTLPGGKVAFQARSAPRDAAAVLAAVRAAGGGALLAG